MGPNQTYKFLHSKGNHKIKKQTTTTTKKTKRQPTEWDKIFANDATYKKDYTQ